VEGHDVGELERHIEQVQGRLRAFVDEDRLAELIRIIKNPGWTTPAEFHLVNTGIEMVGRQVDILDHLTIGLLEGSQKVSSKERAAV
jgi:hypothetical protein